MDSPAKQSAISGEHLAQKMFLRKERRVVYKGVLLFLEKCYTVPCEVYDNC